MRYGTKDRRIVRWVWNSRDGVTPFGIKDPISGEDLVHLGPWAEDAYEPDYKPKTGDLVFIDLHPEKALKLATDKVELYWDHPTYPMRDSGRTKEEWVRIFFDEMTWVTHPETGEKLPKGEPDLIVWQDPDEYERRVAELDYRGALS